MSETLDPKVREALEALFQKLSENVPELAAILGRAYAGELTEEAAMGEMLTRVLADPALEGRVTAVMHETLAPLRGTEVALPDKLDGGTIAGLVFHPPGGGPPKLNPLYAAAIVERLQFDGDIPELRFGPMAKEAMPAVSVATKARNPVAIGRMMAAASASVKQQIEVHERERRALIEAVAGGDKEALAVVSKHGELVTLAGGEPAMDLMLYGGPETDIPTYRRGEVPTALVIPTPTGADLATLTPAEEREAAWKVLGTTQGRRSGVAVIARTAAALLMAHGIRAEWREQTDAEAVPLAEYGWMVSLAGAGATQSAFSTLDVAARAMALGLQRVLPAEHPERLALEIVPINMLDVRAVGWSARLFPV